MALVPGRVKSMLSPTSLALEMVWFTVASPQILAPRTLALVFITHLPSPKEIDIITINDRFFKAICFVVLPKHAQLQGPWPLPWKPSQ